MEITGGAEAVKVLIGQPVHETSIYQLQEETRNNATVDAVLYPEGYLSNENELNEACRLAKEQKKMIIAGYRTNGKDRAVIIDSSGEMILERAKTPKQEKLNQPSMVEAHGMSIGYLLCMEILQGLEGLEEFKNQIDFIFHPIGVGMFSEDQFGEWIGEARKIAITHQMMIMGSSHADGSYRNCGVSIPIAYCIDRNGKDVFISKNDLRSRIIDVETKSVEITS